MIAQLTGHYTPIDASSGIVDVNGVGYLVFVPVGSFRQEEDGGATRFHVSTNVKQDGIELYAFKDVTDRTLFERLIKVSGVGPKLGLAALSCYSSVELVSAIENDDIPRLTAIPGVGKKTAQRLALELKGKFHDLDLKSTTPTLPTSSTLEDLRSALLNLGFADRNIQILFEEDILDQDQPLDKLVRQSLAFLTKLS